MHIIQAGHLLTGRDDRSAGPVRVAVDEDGCIASVTAIDGAALSDEERRLLLMPALTDAHDHGRGLSPLAFGAADQPLESWVIALRRQPRLDPYLNAAVALGRLAEAGVAAVTHCHNTQDGSALLAEAEAISRAARDVGIAVAFAWPFFDRNATVYGSPAPLVERLPPDLGRALADRQGGFRSCAENMALIERATAFEHALFRIQYHPVAPQWVEDATLTAIAGASAADGRRIHTHLFETQRQRAWADAAYPRGLVSFLDDVGFLSPRLTVAHAVWLREDEIALLAERGVAVSINLSSNLRLRSGLPPLAAIARAGAVAAYGLDGMALDDDQDMLRELRLARLCSARDASSSDLAILRASWTSGRRTIVGDDGGGVIEAGRPADLVTIDFAALAGDSVAAEPDALALLIGRAQRRHVRHLFVGGRLVVADGRCRTVDLPAMERALLADARASRAAAPPDDDAIDRLIAAIDLYYADGCHTAPA